MRGWLLGLAALMLLPLAPACGGSSPAYYGDPYYGDDYYYGDGRYRDARYRDGRRDTRYRRVDYRRRDGAVCRAGYYWDGRVCRYRGQGRDNRGRDYVPVRYRVN